ncbi:MAG: AraC family transcriptional regulator [Phenylobacterium sp.]|nr:AraC family transcriptional regulator [Phenylobacterium sp.]
MSRRSFIRHFPAEAGMGFAEWRRRLRLLLTRQLMAEGVSVTEAAIALGYGSASAFIAMVRRELRVTPRRIAGLRVPAQTAGMAVALSASR